MHEHCQYHKLADVMLTLSHVYMLPPHLERFSNLRSKALPQVNHTQHIVRLLVRTEGRRGGRGADGDLDHPLDVRHQARQVRRPVHRACTNSLVSGFSTHPIQRRQWQTGPMPCSEGACKDPPRAR